MKRIFLYLATNLAIVLVLGITLRLLGFERILDEQGVGLDINSLLLFAALFGFGGSFISLAVSKWMARRSTGAKVISTIVMWFSRRREFHADAGGARLAGTGKMIAALERLKRSSEKLLTACGFMHGPFPVLGMHPIHCDWRCPMKKIQNRLILSCRLTQHTPTTCIATNVKQTIPTMRIRTSRGVWRERMRRRSWRWTVAWSFFSTFSTATLIGATPCCCSLHRADFRLANIVRLDWPEHRYSANCFMSP
jgi:Zn-dependent protease with chaperone function